MPYTYSDKVVEVLDETQRGLINQLFQSTWSGPPANVLGATIRTQAGDVKVIEVTGTKLINNESQLPDPPFDVVDTDGSKFTIQLTERGGLNPGQINALNNFIASVWPGNIADVVLIDFLRIVDDDDAFQMRVTLQGTMTAPTADDLPKGKRFRIRNKS